MLSVRPNSPVRHIDGAVNRLLGDFFDEFPTAGNGVAPRVPLVNSWEDEQCLYFEAELPGYEMNEVDVLVQGDVLTIRGKHETEEPQGVQWRRRERPMSNAFQRSFQLGHDVHAEKVEAVLQAGLLRITLPKAEHALPRKIEVKAAPGS